MNAMTDATELDVAAVRARCEAATPGPWVEREENVEHYFRHIGEYGVICSPSEADAEFIAHARTDLPAALDEITRLRAALDEARADRDAEALRADDLSHEILTCDRLDLLARAEAAEKERDEAQAEVERVSEDRDDFDRGLAAAIEQRDAAEAERDRAIETASHEQHLARQWWERAEAAESALAAVRALADERMTEDERSPEENRWGVGWDAGYTTAMERVAALATPTTPEETQP